MKVTRSIVTTQFQVYRMEVKEGVPVAILEGDERILGTAEVSEEQVNKLISKKYGKGYIACNLSSFTELRGMNVETFYENSESIKRKGENE